MSTPHLFVRDLIARMDERDMFPAAIKDEELYELINAAERLIGRARQELNVRLTAEFGDQP
jgi:hypothetical protein